MGHLLDIGDVELGGARLDLDGGRRTYAELAAMNVPEDAAIEEWASAGRRSFAISMVMPIKDSAVVFAEHRAAQACY